MRILVLGGSVFLSRAVAAEAAARGHDVTCAHRGVSGPSPAGTTTVHWEREDAPPPSELTGATYAAVVDVARHPCWVRRAVVAFPTAHWTFVSTISVYADNATPGQSPATGAVLEPRPDDGDPATSTETYGAMKVACEQIVRADARAAFVVRPGLIVGPGDPTGRFTYWPERLAAAATDPTRAEVVAPGAASDAVQVIDVRDLAAWIVTGAETGHTGTYDAIGAPTTFADLLRTLADDLAPAARLTWLPDEFLLAEGVEPWSGEASVPLWLPRPDYAGMLAHDAAPARDAGLAERPLTETARDLLAWLDQTPRAPRTGIGPEREATLLGAWRQRGALRP